MDIQMPVMDGLTATRHLKKMSGSDKIPLIAMTANAMIQDIEACHEAGMCDHIPKPITPSLLYKKLLRWISQDDSPNKNLESNPDAPLESGIPAETLKGTIWTADLPERIEGINLQEGLARMNGKPSLYLKVLRKFAIQERDFPKRFTEALESGRNEEASRYIHTLKGLVGNIGANRCFELSETLDTSCKYGDKDIILQNYKELEPELEALFQAISQALETNGQSHGEAPEGEGEDNLLDGLKELEAYLAEFSSKAVEKSSQLASGCKDPSLASKLSAIEKLASIYEYDNAAEELNSLMAGVKEG